jgi:hypothetical protein
MFKKIFKRDEKGHFSVLAILLMVVGGLALAAGIAFLFGWILMLLWNWLMPEIFGVKTIGYWQAWGLFILASILFKGGLGGGRSDSGKRSKRDKDKSWKAEYDSCARENDPGKEKAEGPGPKDQAGQDAGESDRRASEEKTDANGGV